MHGSEHKFIGMWPRPSDDAVGSGERDLAVNHVHLDGSVGAGSHVACARNVKKPAKCELLSVVRAASVCDSSC
jgi:hypothetical protein